VLWSMSWRRWNRHGNAGVKAFQVLALTEKFMFDDFVWCTTMTFFCQDRRDHRFRLGANLDAVAIVRPAIFVETAVTGSQGKWLDR
jgi:hypothetical protein